MAQNYDIKRGTFEHVAVFHFESEELRGIAEALGYHDVGAQEMLRAAEDLDAANAAEAKR